MRSLVRFTPIIATLLPLTANAQDGRQPPQSAVVLKLREEARKLDSAKISQFFSALSDAKVRTELSLTAQQLDLAGRLDKLTREVIKAWLVRDLDAATPPSRDLLERRLSERGEQFRARIVNHAEALALEGVLTRRQARAWMDATERKAEPLLKGRFGPQTEWIPADNLGAEDLAQQLRQIVRSRTRAGYVFHAMLGGPRLGEFLDPKTKRVRPNLVGFARPFMPNVELSLKECGLADRLNTLTLDIFGGWLTRDLEKTPLPPSEVLRQRLVEHRRLDDSLSAHAEAIALEAILTTEQADRCLCAIWRQQGMRALLDPALASRLRLSWSQREAILFVLGEKNRISDAWTEAQTSLVGLTLPRPELLALGERVANDARGRLQQADGLIWDCLTPAQIRILSRIMGEGKQPAPRPAVKRKRPGRQG